MVNFERNQRDFIRKQIKEVVENPRIGRVVEVYEHTVEDDDTNFEVDVNFPNEDTQHRQIPYEGVDGDSIAIPQVGDKVMVEYRRGAGSPPIARNFVYTNVDRPPVGRAGMWRQRFITGDTPAGDGNLYITGYTEYDGDPSETDKSELEPESTWVQIAKHDDEEEEPVDSAPMKIEVYDSEKDDASHVSLELNTVDGEDASATWGIKFDAKEGTFKLVDPAGYGIESDGEGGFTWHNESIDFSEGTTMSL